MTTFDKLGWTGFSLVVFEMTQAEMNLVCRKKGKKLIEDIV